MNTREKTKQLRFQPVTANCIVLKEWLNEGQEIAHIRLELLNYGEQVRTITATTVGHKRILRFPQTTFNEILVTIPAWKKKRVKLGMELFLCPAFE